MKRRLAQLALASLLFSVPLFAGDTLDRIVATVNRRPILASDVDDEAQFEALQQGRPPASSDQDRRAVLNHVIERELICQQMPDGFEPDKEVIDRNLADLRALYPQAKSDQQWESLLDKYGLDPATLRGEFRLQLQVLHFIDVRLRPTVRVDRDEVADYYNGKLVPQVKAAGATPDPLDKVQNRIEEVLLQTKMTEVFNAWIANLRNQGSIRILDPTLAPPSKDSEKGARAAQ